MLWLIHNLAAQQRLNTALVATGSFSVSEVQSVAAFRVERMRRAPRNWTYWVAFFTLLNGVFLALGQDILILAGLVFPFLLGSAWPHFLAAVFVAAMAYFSARLSGLLAAGLVIYIGDALLAAYLDLWPGLVMHIVVLAFVGMALAGARQLSKQLEPATQGSGG